MKNIIKDLAKRQQTVNELIKKSNSNLAKYKDLPDIHIQSCRSRGYEQYYCFDEESHKRKYIKSEELKQYTKIVQRDYEVQINKKLVAIQKRLNRINRDIQGIDLDEIKKIYAQMQTQRKQLIVPIIESDEDYIARWNETHKGGQNSFPVDSKIYTARGECVRSKSEKIIADLLDKYDVPYKYEPKLELGNGHVISPDFVVLNVRLKKTIYWEHLGLIDYNDYASKNLQKINDYENCGYEIGDNLILTMETSSSHFDSRRFEEKIRKLCL